MKIALLFVLVACSACVQASSTGGITYDPCQPVVVVPAADTTPTQLQAVRDAIALWNGMGLAKLTLDEAQGAQHLPLSFQDGPDPFHGVYEPDRGDVIVNSKVVDPAEAVIVVAHELGHAMSLTHVAKDERASVMNPDNLDQAPTAADEAALSFAWSGCTAR